MYDYRKTHMESLLRSHVCTVSFDKKSSGMPRIMVCTLNPRHIPSHAGSPPSYRAQVLATMLVVWDLEKQDWRAFHDYTVWDFEIHEDTPNRQRMPSRIPSVPPEPIRHPYADTPHRPPVTVSPPSRSPTVSAPPAPGGQTPGSVPAGTERRPPPVAEQSPPRRGGLRDLAADGKIRILLLGVFLGWLIFALLTWLFRLAGGA